MVNGRHAVAPRLGAETARRLRRVQEPAGTGQVEEGEQACPEKCDPRHYLARFVVGESAISARQAPCANEGSLFARRSPNLIKGKPQMELAWRKTGTNGNEATKAIISRWMMRCGRWPGRPTNGRGCGSAPSSPSRQCSMHGPQTDGRRVPWTRRGCRRLALAAPPAAAITRREDGPPIGAKGTSGKSSTSALTPLRTKLATIDARSEAAFGPRCTRSTVTPKLRSRCTSAKLRPRR
mmetsp:Transcript_46213/g.119548  ORF Transcript_46213/g.119548 Transcript_46213/m.119548 type:complete len:237 (+) Transcript_46213:244-954(+)